MEELLKKIEAEFNEFKQEANLLVVKGNKSAGTRSRKSSLRLADLLKQWRAESVNNLVIEGVWLCRKYMS